MIWLEIECSNTLYCIEYIIIYYCALTTIITSTCISFISSPSIKLLCNLSNHNNNYFLKLCLKLLVIKFNDFNDSTDSADRMIMKWDGATECDLSISSDWFGTSFQTR